MLELLRRFLFPGDCLSCSQKDSLSPLLGVCRVCLRSHRKIRTQHHSDQETLCQTQNLFWDSLHCMAERTPWDRELMELCKFRAQVRLCGLFGLLLQNLRNLPRPHAIVLLPSRDWRVGRDFHPAGLLARRLSRKFQAPLLPLVAKVSEAKQSQKNFQERYTHAKIAWKLVQNPEKGSTIWLVDDILTTGASLNQVAYLLKSAGAREVHGIIALRSQIADVGEPDPKRNPNPQIFWGHPEGGFRGN